MRVIAWAGSCLGVRRTGMPPVTGGGRDVASGPCGEMKVHPPGRRLVRLRVARAFMRAAFDLFR